MEKRRSRIWSPRDFPLHHHNFNNALQLIWSQNRCWIWWLNTLIHDLKLQVASSKPWLWVTNRIPYRPVVECCDVWLWRAWSACIPFVIAQNIAHGKSLLSVYRCIRCFLEVGLVKLKFTRFARLLDFLLQDLYHRSAAVLDDTNLLCGQVGTALGIAIELIHFVESREHQSLILRKHAEDILD